jgi:hypothetical protein
MIKEWRQTVTSPLARKTMRTFAHIIHPCLPPTGSDLHVAQPITFATLRTARAFAQGQVDVQLYAVKQQDEDFALPAGFVATPDLTRTVGDVATFAVPRKLALLADILDRLYAAAPAAEYLIYTNVDIAVQPHFYLAVDALLTEGCDAMVINRRTITARYRHVAEIPLMYAEVGEPHVGHDCFIFKRNAYPDYDLGQICIGAVGVGAALAVNLLYQAANFREYTDLHLTFHVGSDRAWRAARYDDYLRHNVQEFRQILASYRAKYADRQPEFVADVEQRVLSMLWSTEAAANPPTISFARRLGRRLRSRWRRLWQ